MNGVLSNPLQDAPVVPGDRPGWLKALGFGALMAASLVMTSALMRLLLPFPQVPNVEAKIEHLATSATPYDVLFLGTSRIYRQISPSIFDELTREGGRPFHAFNLGIDAMRPPEDAYVLEIALKARPEGWKFVCVELNRLRAEVDRENAGTIRAAYWHDVERTALVLRRALVAPHSFEWRRRLADGLQHLTLFAQRSVNFGQGTRLTAWLSERRPKLSWKPLGPRRDGFTLAAKRDSMSDSERIRYQRELAALREKPASPAEFDPISQEALERVIGQIEEVGAIPVLLVLPTTIPFNFYPREARRRFLRILDFSDPAAYPELFLPENRLDRMHLNSQGAQVFTRILAARFLECISDLPANLLPDPALHHSADQRE